MSTGIHHQGKGMAHFERPFTVALAIFALLPSFAWAAKLPEGTDVRLQVTDKLSSATATEGQRFNLVLDEDVRVGDVVLVSRGAKAVGTVISTHKRGHMGKAGELNVQINYLLVGEQRIPLRASSGREGDSKVGATVALTILFGPLGLLKRGKDVELNPGVVLTAQVDQTTEINVGSGATPVAPVSAPAAAYVPGQPSSGRAAADAYANPSAASARGELVRLGCSDNFAVVSSGAGRSIFEATCTSGKRQLLECYGSGCRLLN